MEKATAVEPKVKFNLTTHMCAKVPCKLCGCMTARGNQPRHRQTNKCKYITLIKTQK